MTATPPGATADVPTSPSPVGTGVPDRLGGSLAWRPAGRGLTEREEIPVWVPERCGNSPRVLLRGLRELNTPTRKFRVDLPTVRDPKDERGSPARGPVLRPFLLRGIDGRSDLPERKLEVLTRRPHGHPAMSPGQGDVGLLFEADFLRVERERVLLACHDERHLRDPSLHGRSPGRPAGHRSGGRRPAYNPRIRTPGVPIGRGPITGLPPAQTPNAPPRTGAPRCAGASRISADARRHQRPTWVGRCRLVG